MRYFRIVGNYNGQPFMLEWNGSVITPLWQEDGKEEWIREVEDEEVFDGEKEAFVYLRGMSRGLGLPDGGNTCLGECDSKGELLSDGEWIPS